MTRASPLLVIALAGGCGAAPVTRTAPASASSAVELAAAPPAEPHPAHETAATSPPPTGAPRWGIGGDARVRYRFPIPDGFTPMGVIVPFGADAVEFAAAQPAGVALPADTFFKPSSVVVHRDPLGLGRDMTRAPVSAELLAALHDFHRSRFAQPQQPHVVTIGRWRAIATELGEVAMPDRPLRGGKTYLILDGTATVSVDCLWLPRDQATVRAACDAVAAGLVRDSE